MTSHLKRDPLSGYDIIGDVHGYRNELERLLKKMGYSFRDNVWSHPERKAVYVGDFICRGPDSRGVLEIVRNMVDNEAGYAVLGNHELNVAGFLTLDKSEKSIYTPSDASKKVITDFVNQFAGETSLLTNHVKWLRRLPLYLDFGVIRIAHAYWNPADIALIDEKNIKGKLTKKNLKEIFRKKTNFTRAVLRTTRGITLKMPKNLIVKDKKGSQQTHIRIKWWDEPFEKTFRELSFGNKFILPGYTVPKQLIPSFRVYDETEPLFFFGHYNVKPHKLMLRKNLCCVDNGVATSGYLTAYRWSGESEVREENFFAGRRDL